MSFGFGFALPAYPLRGGGGNNPFNQDGATLDLSFVDGATNVGDQLGADTYTLNTDFITPEYQVAAQYAVWVDGAGLTQVNFADIVTFTRASTGTFFNSAGTLTSAAINEARFDYDPATLLARGFLIEEARTNSIRNNTMVGAVAGTPGTLPTNWSGVAPADNVNREIVGTGTQNGINYIDVKFNGTSGTATTVFLVLFESNTQVAASNGQTWSSSVFVSVVGGNTNNITALNIRQTFRDGAGASLQANDSSLLAATSSLNRFSVTATGANANIAFINSSIVANFADNSAVDITLRIGLPQLELGAFATSVIPTTTTALTRSADVASVNTLSPWYNASEGTLYAEAVALAPTATCGLVSLNDTTSLNRVDLRLQSSTARMLVTVGGVAQASISASPPPAANAIFKFSGAYKLNDFAVSLSGAAAVTDTSATVPTVTEMDLGCLDTGSQILNGWLRRITYYPRRLSDADLQTITI